jgi:hypothetical protein
MNDTVKMLKLMRRDNAELVDAYKDAVCWLAFSALLNVVLIITLFLA